MKLKNEVVSKIHLLTIGQEGFSWELISSKFSADIVSWRNDKENLKYFQSQRLITLEDQEQFLSNYALVDRVDFVLLNNKKAIGVFNIKNLSTAPEYGALIGDLEFRAKGIASWAKLSIFRFWFDDLGQSFILLKNRKNNCERVKENQRKGYVIEFEDDHYITFKVTKKDFNQQTK